MSVCHSMGKILPAGKGGGSLVPKRMRAGSGIAAEPAFVVAVTMAASPRSHFDMIQIVSETSQKVNHKNVPPYPSSSRLRTSSAMASEAVRPGDSMP